MLGAAFPASATTLHTSTSSAAPASPTRPSRLRGLSYLRTYTHNHLRSSSNPLTPPPLVRSTSSPGSSTPPQQQPSASVGIQSGGGGWLPTVHGRPALSRESLPPTSTDTVPVERQPGMARTRAATSLIPDFTSSQSRRSSAGNAGPSRREADSSNPELIGSVQPREKQPTIKFIPHVEARSARPSLHFTASSHKLEDSNSVVRVGRYSERDAAAPGAHVIPVGFKSKVVSRRHCEFWCTNGQWFVKDVKSSSGTFLNHVRLSSPGSESRPYPVNDGDVVQLGIDFKGGEEVIFRCVKIRIECNRGWQKSLNTYNTTAHKRLMNNALGKKARDSDVASVNSSECSICLNPVAPCQPLFVAPCSHVWHYKCIKNLLIGPHYPNFLCPNCRFVADLEADVEPPEELEEMENNDLDPHLAAHESSSTDDNERSEHDTEAHHDDDELADLLRETNLTPTQPITITHPPHMQPSAPSETAIGARSTTPTSSSQHALASPSQIFPEGPMTPRNDIGPFVFDGSAGRVDAVARARPSEDILYER